MRTEDGCIIQECLDGEPEAFGVLVDKYKAGIYAFVYSKLRDFRDAQDVTQEVFERAYRDLHSLRRWESFHFWIYRIASTRCKKWLRSQSRRPDSEFIEDQGPEILKTRSMDSYRESRVDESLQEALDSLSETYREVVMLHYFGGMTSEEMAKAMGTSPTAIRMRLSRARAQLREEMVAMMGTAFEGQRLQSKFTFHVVEIVKRIKVHPTPRAAGLPWGISLAAGIIIAIMSLGSHISISSPMAVPTDLPVSSETEMLKTRDIPVNLLRISQIQAISKNQGYKDGGGPGLPDEQSAFSMAPRGAEDGFPEEPAARLGNGTVRHIAYAPDGKLLAAAGSLGIWLYDADNLNEVGLLEGHTDDVVSVAFSPDGGILASGSWDSTVRLWDVQKQEQVGKLQHANWVSSIAFSPDGKLIASGSGDKTLRLWDVQKQEQVGKLEGHTAALMTVAFSRDGSMIASGSADQTVRLWDVREQKPLGELRGHTAQLTCVAFSHDGKLLASGSYWPDGVVRLWDVQGQKQVGVLQHMNNDVNCVTFSPDGKLLASGDYSGKVRLWEIATEKLLATLSRHTDAVFSTAFSPDGKTLASSSSCAVRFWDVDRRKQMEVLEAYTGETYCVTFSLDGKLLASGGRDRLVRLWNVAEQKQVGGNYSPSLFVLDFGHFLRCYFGQSRVV